MTLLQFTLINIGALLTALGGVFLKKLAEGASFSEISVRSITEIIFNPFFVAGAFCYVIPVLFWAYILKTMELTKLQPLLSLVYIYTLIVAFIFLGEQPSMARLSGILLIVFGVIIVGKS